MAYERITVTYDVVWEVAVSETGTELPPRYAYTLGKYETEGDAARALAEDGFTRHDWFWRKGSYLYGDIRRTLVEVK